MPLAFIESLGWWLTYLIIVFGIFLLIRQLVLWYFRLNEIADNIAYIAHHYRVIDHEAGVKRIEQARQQTGAGSPFAPMGNRR